MAPDIVIIGCPLLLQLWSYERFAIARSNIILSPYEKDLYHDTQEDTPTTGTLSTSRRISTISIGQYYFN
jgi:hypothetical protein